MTGLLVFFSLENVENFSFLKFLSPFFQLLLLTFVSYKVTKI
jgi:hypothetical protein